MNTEMNAKPILPDDHLFAAIEQQLAAELYRFSCPGAEELLNYRWGLLVDEQFLALQEHLRHCPHCAQDVAAFSGPPTQEMPEKEVTFTRPRFLAKWIPVVAAVRMAERGNRDVHVQYYQVVELGWDVTLNWMAEPGMTFALQGQLFGPEPSEMEEIKVSTPSLGTVTPDKKGFFVFTAVSPGQHELHILSPHGEIVLPPIDLS